MVNFLALATLVHDLNVASTGKERVFEMRARLTQGESANDLLSFNKLAILLYSPHHILLLCLC